MCIVFNFILFCNFSLSSVFDMTLNKLQLPIAARGETDLAAGRYEAREKLPSRTKASF